MIISRAGSRDEFPLAFASCNYHVVDVQAFVAVEQLYVSTANTAQQVAYVLPLPPGATVCAFKAVFDGRKVVKGVVTERKVAKKQDETRTSKSRTVALLGKEHADSERTVNVWR